MPKVILATCGRDYTSKVNQVTLLDLHQSKKFLKITTEETHDLVQSPLNSNLFVAFGRRPPIQKSYIINSSENDECIIFSADDNHSFYGHGFWSEKNYIGTCEINNINFKSQVTIRDGDNPDIIMKRIPVNGFAIHSIKYINATDEILIACNGNWIGEDLKNNSTLELINFKTEARSLFTFEHMPVHFGFQHFCQFQDEIYCLFRNSPQSQYDSAKDTSPLLKLNMKTGMMKNISFLNKDFEARFASDGLSLAVNKNFIVATSQRGNVVVAWNRETERQSFLEEIPLASGVTFLAEDKVAISSGTGVLYEIDLNSRVKKIITTGFFAGSHHQIFSID